MVVSVSSINESSGTFHTVRSNTTTSGGGVATKPAQQCPCIQHKPTDETEGDNGSDGMPGSEDAELLGCLNIGPKMGGPSTTDIDMIDVDQMEKEEEEEGGGN